jgi:hypothetical protein
MKIHARILGVLLLAVLLSAGTGRSEEQRGTGADLHRLNMEELEVRGIPEKLGVLYSPVPEGVSLFSPVRFDLIREELIRPVLPQAVSGETHPRPRVSP